MGAAFGILQTVHGQKISQFIMIYSAGGIIDIVIGDKGFFHRVIYTGKSGKLSVISFIFGDAVSLSVSGTAFRL